MKVTIIYKDEKKWEPSIIYNVTKILECSGGVDIVYGNIIGFYSTKHTKEIKIDFDGK